MTQLSKTFRGRMRDERGIALVVVILVSLAVAAIAVGATMMATNTRAIDLYSEQLGSLESSAEAGLEFGRARVNGKKALYPDSSFQTLEDQAPVYDAAGNVIRGLKRSLYVGPTGVTSGQYGVFGSVVAVVEDNVGNKIVRRGEVFQESFAKFAYFTDNEGGNIYFGGGDQIFGPVHTNDQIKIHSTGATFHSTVETAKNIYQKNYGTFHQGYTEYGKYIPMPTTADLTKLKNQATAGQTAFVGDKLGNFGQATTRIEFIAIDINNDGDVTDGNEGFIRVYQANSSANAFWVTGDVPTDYNTRFLQNAQNCGDFHGGQFVSALAHGTTNVPWGHNWQVAVDAAAARCYLGGADEITNGFTINDGRGQWRPWPGAIAPEVQNVRPNDAQYLFPINRQFNPSFKGVIFVDGHVAVSGVIRGEVTVAASGNIILADDVRYATDPGAGTCNNIAGMFAGENVVVADNTLNAPVIPRSGRDYKTFDDTRDEFFHTVILALSQFTVENYNSGSGNDEWCEGTQWGRGCLYLTGGIIQEQRGPVGTTGGTGYLKRYAYDQCAQSDPPPYFPTTGRFARGRYFEIDPVGFDVAKLYAQLTPK